jgi:hypothetical protein
LINEQLETNTAQISKETIPTFYFQVKYP